MKEFDLFKFIGITTIFAITITLLFQIDYNTTLTWQEFTSWMEQPFEWKNGHFYLLVFVIMFYGNK